MDDFFKQRLGRLSHEDILPLLLNSNHGLEKECLRVNSDGTLALTPHPKPLGSPLLHPFISTDFSESQLELITPVIKNESLLVQFMHLLHGFIFRSIDEEMLWPFSSPCILPDEEKIPIARYGSTSLAKEKELYRLGLAYRYGRKMQALSGVHYNFSFSDSLIKKLSFQQNASDIYLHMVRNYLRFGWLITYLFGSTPVLDATYFSKIPKDLTLLAPHTVGNETATSLRMSEYGYYSKLQNQIHIGFNQFENYVSDLQYAVSTPEKKWKPIGDKQINDHIIQIEAEHYSRIRPKPPVCKAIRPLEGLKRRGIVYLEVRGMDLNPWTIEGISLAELEFLHVFLLFCFLEESPFLSSKEENQLTTNQNLVALKGRDPKLELFHKDKKLSLKSWGKQIFDSLFLAAKLLDTASESSRYTDCVNSELQKIINADLTPSQKLLSELSETKSSFRTYAARLADKQKNQMLSEAYPKEFMVEMEKTSSDSEKNLYDLEAYEEFILKGYEDLELSTQSLIREALYRGIKVEVLDRKANFLRLCKDGVVEYVKNATMTSKDTLISYWLMENKEVTKKLLSERGFSVPEGSVFTTPKEALEAYHEFESKKIILKPNRMNYGIGIHTVDAFDLEAFEKGIGSVFEHGQEVLIEDFIEGEEYRFLVISGKVQAICTRIPANVVGDGKRSISELIEEKNHNIFNYKIPKYYIRQGAYEQAFLKKRGLDFASIPKKGERIFLRDNSNVSTGGDSIDKTEAVHPGYSKIACQAAKVACATFCGVDIIIADPKKSPSKQNYSIIELNFNPALWIHRYPTLGQKRYVEKAVLDTLGFV